MGSHRVGHDWRNLACRQHHLWPRMRGVVEEAGYGKVTKKNFNVSLKCSGCCPYKRREICTRPGDSLREDTPCEDGNRLKLCCQSWAMPGTTGNHRKCQLEKNAQPKSWELCFIWWTKLRTEVQNTASQIALRDCSEEVRGASIVLQQRPGSKASKYYC